MDKKVVERFFPKKNMGLQDFQVQQRIQEGLYNKQTEKITKSYKMIWKDNICTLFNLVNAILGALIIITGSYRNLLFLGVVISNTAIGIFQEIRAKRTLDKLSLISKPHMKVLRNGKIQDIHMNDLVLDDIMLIQTGSQICADAIIMEGKVETNESLVTGEADIITKEVGDFLYSGSFIISGNAKVKVEHVGSDNYVQTIMSEAKILKKHKSQLRDSIDFLIKHIGIILIPIGILLFAKQFYISHYTFAVSIQGTVAALIGMIPEGLVLLTSVALAVSAINLAKRKTLVQELYCIETLARVDTLCLDKTGTITQGHMSLDEVIIIDKKDITSILANINYALQDDNSTAQALKAYAGVQNTWHIKETLPFSSVRKLSAVTFENEGTYAIGAYSFVCKEKDKELQLNVDNYAKKGNRVLVLAHSQHNIIQQTLPSDMKVIALLLFSDPIRKEAPETLDYFEKQGVDIKIISGDDPQTVHEIARKARLKNYQSYVDASTLSDQEIYHAVQKYSVFGRVSPHQKKLMIQSLKQQNHVVAMTGDGVNDVMALKEADCSIAVASGSEAAKNIANLVLLDNNFAHMPYIVAEGRRVINNIQRAASLFLVKTTFSLFLSFFILFIIPKYPFIPIQLTLISTLTIGIPSFFLALEPNYNIVQGNFLINVLSKAIPGALMVVIIVIYVNILKIPFQYSEAATTTMCVILTGISGLIVLKRVCTPFSKNRLLLFLTMCILFTASILCIKEVFSLVTLTSDQLFWLVIGIVAIPFLMNIFYRIGGKMISIKEKIINMLEKK